MSLNGHDRAWHDRYVALPPPEKFFIDEAFRTLTKGMREEGIRPANDDRAEALIAAITRFVIESRRT
jgi:hypothetical protein